MLHGDFTAATNGTTSSGSYPIPGSIYDPTNLVNGKRQQFSCNGVLNAICPNRIDPVGQKLLSMYPTDQVQSSLNVQSSGQYNYFSNATEGDTDNSIDLRVDHQLNAKHSFFGHFDRFSNYIFNPNVWGNGPLSKGPGTHQLGRSHPRISHSGQSHLDDQERSDLQPARLLGTQRVESRFVESSLSQRSLWFSVPRPLPEEPIHLHRSLRSLPVR